jgi:hypothetical protein
MFMAMFPGLVYSRLEDDTRKRMESSSDVRKTIFEKLTVGVNVYNTDIYQKLAIWLLNVPEEDLKKLKMEDVIGGIGEYIDTTGHLE